MDQDKQFEAKFNEFKQRSTYVTSFSGLIKQLFASEMPYSWKIIQYLLETAQKQNINNYRDLKRYIELQVKASACIKSFTTLIFLYSLKLEHEYGFYNFNWRNQYQRIACFESDLPVFSQWIVNKSSSKITQQTLSLVIKYFPKFIKKQYIGFSELQLQSVIQWVTYYETIDPDTDKFIDACELIKVAKQKQSGYSKTQNNFFKKLIEIVVQCKNPSSNILLFLYPMPIIENQVERFCLINVNFLTDVSEDGLCTFFKAITNAGICKQSLAFIKLISCVLANEEDFYKLRYLYQHYILPVLIPRAKACRKVQQTILEIGLLYILGFLKHCDIGIAGIQSICKNIGKITNQKVRRKWVQLCSLICSQYPQYKNETEKILEGQLKLKEPLPQSQILKSFQEAKIWNITVRNGRKHKRYIKVASKMPGIMNRKNECYIISVTHGLQKNLYFQPLLQRNRDNIKKKLKLLDQMRVLFSQLYDESRSFRSAQPNPVKVSYLKKLGPAAFERTEEQMDAFEYLTNLFQSIQNQMSSLPMMKEQFKNLFEIQFTKIKECRNCKFRTQMKQNSYFHTIQHTEVLEQISMEQLAGYRCQKCQKENTSMLETKISQKSKVFIVHINRFTHTNNIAKKELSTQRILRKFLDYDLYGMVCHNGKNVQSGHYIYFHQINDRKWAEFNDYVVQEFQLSHPYEQFQRDWKAELTPYLLFYQKPIINL